jgi:hypothetical protein
LRSSLHRNGRLTQRLIFATLHFSPDGSITAKDPGQGYRRGESLDAPALRRLIKKEFEI